MKKIDCRDLECPIPVTKIKNYFDSIGEGEAVVYVDNDIALGNVEKYVMEHGYHIDVTKRDKDYEIFIEKRGCLEIIEEQKSISVLITSDKIGEGSEKLGEKLMNSYIDSLSEEDKLPSRIIFLNSGVKLIAEGSDVIEGLHLLEEKGVKIYASKMCLENYKLQNKLLAGSLIEMDEIVHIMNSSDNVIKL